MNQLFYAVLLVVITARFVSWAMEVRCLLDTFGRMKGLLLLVWTGASILLPGYFGLVTAHLTNLAEWQSAILFVVSCSGAGFVPYLIALPNQESKQDARFGQAGVNCLK